MWSFTFNDKSIGPISYEEVVRLIRVGVVCPNTVLYEEGQTPCQAGQHPTFMTCFSQSPSSQGQADNASSADVSTNDCKLQNTEDKPAKRKTGIHLLVMLLLVGVMVYFGVVFWFQNGPVNTDNKYLDLSEKNLIGDCIPVDYQKAADYLYKAVKQGNPIAQLILADNLKKGNDLLGIDKDEEKAEELAGKAFKALLRAAQKGNLRAMRAVVLCYRDGFGEFKDMDKAKQWAKQWAKLVKNTDNAEYLIILGESLLQSTVLDKDVDESIICYKKAFNILKKEAENGNAKAMFKLVACYFLGKGTDQNIEYAKKWCKKSAEKGFVPAMIVFAEMQESPEEGVVWVRKAAELGDCHAQFTYGRILFEGIGVEKDTTKGRQWLRKAKNAGSSKAREYLNSISEDKSDNKDNNKDDNEGNNQ